MLTAGPVMWVSEPLIVPLSLYRRYVAGQASEPGQLSEANLFRPRDPSSAVCGPLHQIEFHLQSKEIEPNTQVVKGKLVRDSGRGAKEVLDHSYLGADGKVEN